MSNEIGKAFDEFQQDLGNFNWILTRSEKLLISLLLKFRNWRSFKVQKSSDESLWGCKSFSLLELKSFQTLVNNCWNLTRDTLGSLRSSFSLKVFFHLAEFYLSFIIIHRFFRFYFYTRQTFLSVHVNLNWRECLSMWLFAYNLRQSLSNLLLTRLFVNFSSYFVIILHFAFFSLLSSPHKALLVCWGRAQNFIVLRSFSYDENLFAHIFLESLISPITYSETLSTRKLFSVFPSSSQRFIKFQFSRIFYVS